MDAGIGAEDVTLSKSQQHTQSNFEIRRNVTSGRFCISDELHIYGYQQ